jgi:hypothetical protein
MSEISDTCRVCGSKAKYLWNDSLLDLTARYFECETCGYVQTEQPYWLDRAYSETINNSDTGIMSRNLKSAQVVLATLVILDSLYGRVVDYAGGYGILVRLLRDYGIDALWSDRYCQNLVARGFEYNSGEAVLVTAFEAFEHFVHPNEEMDRLLAISPNVLLSTELITGSTPAQGDWCYYGKEHGQHIGFFRLKTLEFLAARRGKYMISDGHSYHLISELPANRIVWRALLKARKFLPGILRLKLRSKTWQDHLAMSKLDR